MISSILRPGKRPKGEEISIILTRICKRIQAAWPQTQILFRGDSHASAPEVHDFCDEHNIKFVLGLNRNKTLLKKAQSLAEKAKELFERPTTPVKIYGEFRYKADSMPFNFQYTRLKIALNRCIILFDNLPEKNMP
ncbi:transposase [candidate division KSB1 bacterium]|nr:transposase [candidate division KSB1 bacterium]